ncbi:uncharacterized protein LOC126721848 [Quercus robur]|uniref:uncharacterized protein LOC126721848 n=1 Tax=Quercus robur TaxID=38942 RepID=UPI002162C8BB|nr:uncharacterized protein LOC126721848 [Quercus robur]
MEKKKMSVGFINGLVVPSSGRSGGLAMLWRKEIFVDIQNYSGRHSDAIVTEDSGFKWWIIGFYGNPEVHRRKESWDLLKALNKKVNLPWLCFGDFNEIVSMEEKMGGARRPQRQMDDFREGINCYRLKDLGYCGSDFTWSNMHEGVHRMYLRLYRALATSVLGHVPRQIQNKRKILSDLVLRDQNGSNGSEINKIRKEINDLLDCEEIMWQQRSKVQWIGLGDRNTKYFHTKASRRKKKNTITRLMDERGTWKESTLGVAEVAISYFKKLYTTSQPDRIQEVVDAIDPKVSIEMNQTLIKQFTREEVEAALKEMHSTKSPGLDAWSIWYNRNLIAFDSICQLPSQIWSFAKRFLHEHRNAWVVVNTGTVAQKGGWTPPPPGIFKVNVDGATSEAGRNSSMGATIRDSCGANIAASCKYLQGQFSVVEVEAIAVENGILLA